MDYAIELSDASKALDLSNIRFQLMYVGRQKEKTTVVSCGADDMRTVA